MSKNRLKELQKSTNSWPHVSYTKLSRQRRNHDATTTTNDSSNQFTAIDVNIGINITEFLAQIDLVRILVDEIETLSNQVKSIHKHMLEPMPDPELSKELSNKTVDIKRLAVDVQAKLKRMAQIQKNATQSNKATAQWRIKESQIFTMTRRFRDVMILYNEETVSHEQQCKKLLLRQLEITGIRKTDEELDELLDDHFPGTFTCSIMVETEKAKQEANDIDKRHQYIMQLEESIKQLHDMFSDLAILVETQGAMIDNIEHNVSTTLDYIAKGNKEVKGAANSNSSSRKMKFIICITLIVVVVIIILLAVAYLTIQLKFLGK